jgi:hypothetical protein
MADAAERASAQFSCRDLGQRETPEYFFQVLSTTMLGAGFQPH